jgi:hypothetical protein
MEVNVPEVADAGRPNGWKLQMSKCEIWAADQVYLCSAEDVWAAETVYYLEETS